MVDVMPKSKFNTRSIVNKIIRENNKFNDNSNYLFTDFNLYRKCNCFGISNVIHSPFFIPSEHHPRKIPSDAFFWDINGSTAILFDKNLTGFGGYGIGGAGDNAGGYLGGGFIIPDKTTASLVALRASQTKNKHLLDLLPGKTLAISDFIKNQNKPKMYLPKTLSHFDSSAIPL